MHFEITITLLSKPYRMQVERVYEGESIDRFSITAGGKSVTVQTDYYYLKRMNKRKAADWKIVDGRISNGPAFALTIAAIEGYFKDLNRPPHYDKKAY